MTEMVDTNVLVYAVADPKMISKARLKNNPDYPELLRASRVLVKRLHPLRISAVAWTEFLRVTDAEAELAGLAVDYRIEGFNVPAAQRAASLLNEHRSKQGTCERCIGARNASPCPCCGHHLSTEQRIRDAMILAHAETDAETKVLYTYDRGILSLGQHTDDELLTVRRPPHPDGGLFEAAAATPGKVVPIAMQPSGKKKS